MEACGSAHHWGRELEAMGHRVSLLPPTDVNRYRDGSKTDRADAKALLEAARNKRSMWRDQRFAGSSRYHRRNFNRPS